MATTIIDTKSWKPVTVNIVFTSPEQLAVFVELFGTHKSVKILEQCERLKGEDVSDLMRQLAPHDVWSTLNDILKRHYGEA